MKTKKYAAIHLIAGGVLFLLFVVFTILVKTVDVRSVVILGKPGDSRATATIPIGFKWLNSGVHRHLGVSEPWYIVTQILGYVAIAVAVTFAVIGLIQWIKRKKLLAVDHEILLLGVFYLIVLAFYGLFEIVKINYRPIMPNDVPEASYPSSHTMLAVFVMFTAVFLISRMLKEKPVFALILNCAAMITAGVTVSGRVLSGYHWFTDVAAGGLLALALTLLYCGASLFVTAKKEEKAALTDKANEADDTETPDDGAPVRIDD